MWVGRTQVPKVALATRITSIFYFEMSWLIKLLSIQSWSPHFRPIRIWYNRRSPLGPEYETSNICTLSVEVLKVRSNQFISSSDWTSIVLQPYGLWPHLGAYADRSAHYFPEQLTGWRRHLPFWNESNDFWLLGWLGPRRMTIEDRGYKGIKTPAHLFRQSLFQNRQHED